MDARVGTVPLFATPFASVETGTDGDFNARLVQLCKAARASSAEPPSDPLQYRGPEDFFRGGVAAAALERLVLGQASTVVAALSDRADFGQLHVQARGWCSIVERNGHVPVQHFPGASWLAVYCAQAGEPDAGVTGAGVLRLHERRLGSIYRDAGSREMKAPYRYGNHSWTPVPGRMALFPAHVPHEVSVVRSATPLFLVFARVRFVEPGAPGE